MRRARIKRILLCITILLGLLGLAGYFTIKTLFRNPLLAACKELKPGMSEAQAMATVEKHRDEGFFLFIGTTNKYPHRKMKDLEWIDFPLDSRGRATDTYSTPRWLPVSLHYRDAATLIVWLDDDEVVWGGKTVYHYQKILVLEINTQTTAKDYLLYEDAGNYYLEDNCGPKK